MKSKTTLKPKVVEFKAQFYFVALMSRERELVELCHSDESNTSEKLIFSY